tara:strand:+ start:595 stop:2289 length:1695 start_codon:yes stop_codon:yes gene_type:complete
MSEEQQNNENEVNIDLKGVIKDLAEQIKKLTDIVEKSTKKINANTAANADWHKYQALMRIEQEKEHGRQVRLNKEYGRSAASLQMFTGLLTKGASAGFIFNKLANTIGGVSKELDKYKQELQQLDKLTAKYKKQGLDLAKPENIAEHDILAAQKARTDEAKERMDEKKGGTGKLAEGISSMKAFAEKHKTGILIGAGSIGVLLTVLKKAFDVSPMFQAIKKLLHFGFMLILRPIGDFFGFIMRPIMVLMLRKFIIPWYKDVYPYMKKWGSQLGNAAAGVISVATNPQAQLAAALIITGITAATFAGAIYAFKQIRTMQSAIKNLANINKIPPVKVPPVKVPASPVKPLKLPPPPKVPIIKLPPVIQKGLAKIASLPTVIGSGLAGTATKLAAGVKNVITPIQKAMTNPKILGIADEFIKHAPKLKMGLKMAIKPVPIVGWGLAGLDALGSALKEYSPETYEGIRQGAFGIGKMLGDTEGKNTEGMLDFFGYGTKSTAEQLAEMASPYLGSTTGLGGGRGAAAGDRGNQIVINIDHVSNEADIQHMGNVMQERIQESNKRTVKSY